MAIGNMHKNLVKTGCVFPQICSRTDKYTDRHGHHNTLLPYRGGVIIQLKHISACQIKQFKMWYSNDVVI